MLFKQGDFVKAINFRKNSMENIMFSHQQFYDLIRFGTSDPVYSVLNLDTTFNIGRYYVTYISYRNLSLYIKG